MHGAVGVQWVSLTDDVNLSLNDNVMAFSSLSNTACMLNMHGLQQNDDATDKSLLWWLRDPGWTTALPSKQEKYLITHLRAWSIAMEDAKNYEIRCKIIWNIRTKRVGPFSGQCNLRFLSTKVLQGSVATRENYDRIFIDSFTANLPQSVMVKEFWKSVSISQSYRQK